MKAFRMKYNIISKKELKELSKNYAVDLAGFGKNNRRGAPLLVKRGTRYFNYAVECKTVVRLHKGLKILIKNNLGILTILKDPVSAKIKDFLRDNENTGLILQEP